MQPNAISSDPPVGTACRLRHLFIGLGCLNLALGAIGVVVPGMPTTVFLLIALWAFSKSSARLYAWLWNHPRFGPGIRAWHRHKVIPLKAKFAALATMAASLAYVILYVVEGWLVPAALAGLAAHPARPGHGAGQPHVDAAAELVTGGT
jgi:uncharacterized membrane protein YbaN (DUF454 family)